MKKKFIKKSYEMTHKYTVVQQFSDWINYNSESTIKSDVILSRLIYFFIKFNIYVINQNINTLS